MLTLNLKFKILDFLTDGIAIRNFCRVFPELVQADYYWGQRHYDQHDGSNLMVYQFDEFPGMVYSIFIGTLIEGQDQMQRDQSLYRVTTRQHGYRDQLILSELSNPWVRRAPFFNQLTAEEMAEYLLADYWLVGHSKILSSSQLSKLNPIERYQLIMEKLKEHPPPKIVPWSVPEYPDWLMNYDNPNYLGFRVPRFKK